MLTQNFEKTEISVSLVTKLIAQQFPVWAHLPIKPVEVNGWDNQTFHLGKEMLIRIPSAQKYAAQVQLEQTWLPVLASHLSVTIPKPLALGKPCKEYPFDWSIYQWIEGESANTLILDENLLQTLAIDLAQFLNELHKIDISGAPIPGIHNFWRGSHPSIYDQETKLAITKLQNIINVEAVTTVWQTAISSQWNNAPVWIHGDLSAGNILIKNKQLTAVIDFGSMGIGDPACDLVIAWTLFNHKNRNIFKSLMPLDVETWNRARGWALWKALITLTAFSDTHSPEALNQLHIINQILKK